MMFFLIFNIITNCWHIRFANRKCAESCLPCEVSKVLGLCFGPFGRCCLKLAYCRRKRNRAVKQEEDVCMVFYRVNDDRRAIHVFENRCHVGMEVGAYGIVNESFPVFCGEHEVDEIMGEGLGHDGSRVARG